ncbi:ABC transporter substrate-binding protein [Pseudomonas typographi]|uniref:ABC transporter substrate-binding protein n=1 Tax=Pseudomonas typographi TaxID=2715964 RepID=A0ABR7YWS8_9PSED|nr:ABC transporter substrate-binding protein [Pseudomonas typographi]MBD1552610.1 ABC transporter substrate-binding protein [Pseudomonas typographi]MBD1586191.1 ABC transporter substrate-binding protein [Pseudomonas typographi]MBD1597662.1 ABC transporter substrate-binding protein [Pseudomonas typographi]
MTAHPLLPPSGFPTTLHNVLRRAPLWALVATLAACSQPNDDKQAPSQPVSGGTLRFAISEVVKCLDTVQYADRAAGAIAQQYFENLVFQDEHGQIHPWLAASWKVSDDGLTYVFTLRQDKVFSDGTPFNAEAVKANIDYILQSTSWTRTSLLRVESATVLGPYTVAIKLLEPDSGTLEALADPIVPMQSPTALAQGAKQNCSTPAGTGPFKVAAFDQQTGVTFVRNEHFTQGPPIVAHQGPAYLEKVEYRFITDNAARLAALQSGAVDAIEGANVENTATFQADPSITLITAARKGIADVFFLNRTQAPWTDERVRKAFIHAVDVGTSLKTAFFGQYAPLYSPISSTTTYHIDRPEYYQHDEAKANALLDEAGWTGRDSEGYRTQGGQRLGSTFTLAASEVPALVSTVQQAQQALKKVGFKLDIQQLDGASALASAYGWNYAVVRLSYSKNSPDIQRALFHSAGGATNADGSHKSPTPVLDPTLDHLLEQATRAGDPQQRQALYEQVQARIGELGVLLPIADQQTRLAYKPQVHGLRLWPASNYVALYDVWLAPGH